MLKFNKKNSEHGASLLEYVFLLLLVALVCVAGVASLGTTTNSSFEASGTAMSST